VQAREREVEGSPDLPARPTTIGDWA
jgi:hypothetical protein